ncbi:MAG: metal-dependent phosphohydrolase [Nocardioidaceae bacterium]|nr:metal-dependent phosphohydrolase [Nocardioidaceae bacterium]
MRTSWQLELGRRWTEPHRHHHGIDHLREVLDALDALAADGLVFDHTTAVEAAWFHDAVYDVRRDDNEERSASLARSLIGGAHGDRVADLVLVTKDHVLPPGDTEATALCDADLSVLGAAPERYHVYAEDIRLEYAHVPPDVFGTRRAAILEGLLDHPSLFASPQGRVRWEAPARENVRAEIVSLRASSDV